MNKFISRIAAPLLVLGALAGPVAAENRSNINAGIGVFGSANEELLDYYSGLYGGRIGLDSKISKDLRFTTNLSAFKKKRTKNNVESEVTFVQVEPMIQYVGEEAGGSNLYCGIGLSFVQASESANYKDKTLENEANSLGLVICGGAEFYLDTDWGGFLDLSYRAAKSDEVNLGGFSATTGVKYFFGKK